MVIFEDLHWADSESIALFERIADLEGDRLLVGTYRPAEVMRRNPIAGLLDRLERRHSVYHVRLERLDLAETSAFLTATTGKPPPYRAAVSLHDRTGGNPFFLEELLRTGEDLETLWRPAAAVEPGRDAAPPGRAPRSRPRNGWSRRPRARLPGPVRPARRGHRPRRGRPDLGPARAGRPGRAGRDRRGRVRVPPRAGAGGGRRAAARPGAAAAARGGAQTRCSPPATPTGRWWPSTPAAPDATTTCWPRPAGAAPPTWPSGSAFQALQLAEMGLRRGARRPGAARHRGPGRLAGRPARRRGGYARHWQARSATAPRTASRRCACGSGSPGTTQDLDLMSALQRRALRVAHRPAARTARTRPGRWPCWPSRPGCATSTTSRCAWAAAARSRSPTSWAGSAASGWPRWRRRARCWPPARPPSTRAAPCWPRWPTRPSRPASG